MATVLTPQVVLVRPPQILQHPLWGRGSGICSPLWPVLAPCVPMDAARKTRESPLLDVGVMAAFLSRRSPVRDARRSHVLSVCRNGGLH